jgi:hypothetical protein
MRRERQGQETPPQQGITPVVPENVFGVTLPGREETVPPAHSETVSESKDDQVIKTSFYPRQDQLDKLDDLAGEYNKRYRRQRKRIDRQDIIRFLIDRCTLDSLEDLNL